MPESCGFDYVYENRYDIFTTLLMSITVLQLMLFVHTMYIEYSRRNSKKFQHSKTMRILFIALQLIAISTFLGDVVRYSIDPLTGILQGNFGCRFLAYVPWYMGGLFWGTYFSLICYRLESSFKGSFLALSRWQSYILRALVLISPITATATLAIDRHDLECVDWWQPSDFSESLPYCTLQFDKMALIKYHVFAILTLFLTVLNITFGVIFCVKLKQFIKVQRDVSSPGRRLGKPDGFAFEILIIKVIILTVFGALSTAISYVVSIVTRDYGAIFLYVDWFVNCMVIGLMFKHNERYFKLLCGPCVVVCFHKWDQDAKDVQLEKYIADKQCRLESSAKNVLSLEVTQKSGTSVSESVASVPSSGEAC